MPRNPSLAQRAASARNLTGHRGPKTAAGKAASSANGRKNPGVKSARAWAKVIQARWGIQRGTLYAEAGCLTCQVSPCLGASLSPVAAHAQLPLPCLDRVFRASPSLCPYYLGGLCCADSTSRAAANAGGRRCITLEHFTEGFRRASSDGDGNLLELAHRKLVLTKKKELLIYLARIRQLGLEHFRQTPRSKSVIRFFQSQYALLPACRFESNSGSPGQKDALRSLLEGPDI